jgi:O-acetyl-ADP-ribose deacetylase (regulator of RNase III)
MINIIDGNLLDAKESVICHQVNCMGVMSSGLALHIKNKYPEVYPAYLQYCKGCKDNNPVNLLGEFQPIEVSDGKIIINIFSQYDFGKGIQHTNYIAMEKALNSLLNILRLTGDSVAFPYNMGCVRGGGDWNIVYKIIENIFSEYSETHDVTIYRLDLG